MHTNGWIHNLILKVEKNPRELIEPIRNFKAMVQADLALNVSVYAMFQEALSRKKLSPTGEPEVRDFDHFLQLLNEIMVQAPEYIECENKGIEDPCGLIGFPINALLDWPMGTASGYTVFSNTLVNQQFKTILRHWSKFLQTEASRYVLVEGDPSATPKVIPWLSETALNEMVSVACQGQDDPKACQEKQFQDFFVCDPSDEYYGYKSWDDFFTREFVAGVRPVASPDDDDIIVNACESGPLQVVENVQETAQFWLKKQPYSLNNMLSWDSYAPQFAGGTVYQAFLSALSYHRWHSPVAGTIKKATIINGSYYLENLYQGFKNPAGADDSAPNDSQAFLTAVATRAIIFIEADNPKIGLMCFMAIGMAEVSSCQVTVEVGQQVKKGEQLGMFHFGGSTHCLLFRPDVKLEFVEKARNGSLDALNIPLKSEIARVL